MRLAIPFLPKQGLLVITSVTGAAVACRALACSLIEFPASQSQS